MKKNKILKIVSSIVFLTAVVVLANTYSKRNEENIYLNNGIDETGRVENSVDEKEQEAIENEEVIEFRADKPFTYYILDDSGNVYFAGRYVKAE